MTSTLVGGKDGMFDEPHRHLSSTFKENYPTRAKEARATQRPTPLDLGRQAGAALARQRLEQEALVRAESLAQTLRLNHPLRQFRRDKQARLVCLHEVLVAVALGLREARGQQRATSITLHSVVELIAFVFGWSRTTATDYLNELEHAGLIARRAHITTTEVEGQSVNRCDGVMLNVKLAPTPTKAHLTLEDLRHQPRNLTADRRAGRTAYRVIQELEQSLTQEQKAFSTNLLLCWALSPGSVKTPLAMTVQVGLSPHLVALLDLPYATFEARGEVVEQAAHEICAALDDLHSHAAWCYLLWNMLQLLDKGELEPNAFQQLRNLVVRARVDREEGFARNAGALAMARVKAWSLWEEVRRVPMLRVGPRPLSS